MYKKIILLLITAFLTLFMSGIAKAFSDEEFDAEVKKADELYCEGDITRCFSFLKQLEIKARKSGNEKHLRILIYMMRLSFELGFDNEAARIQKEIDSKITEIKNTEFLKNLHMAASSVYANSHNFKEARRQIKKSLNYGEAAENLFVYAMIMAKFGEREEAYKTIDKIFKLNTSAAPASGVSNGKGKTADRKNTAAGTLHELSNEEIIMNNMTAAVIALSFEDFSRARGHIDEVMAALAGTSDTGYFIYIYKSLMNNIFSFFEFNPLNLHYYEKMYKMALERGGKQDAGAAAIKIARILSDLGIYDRAAVKLDEAAALLELNSFKLNDDKQIKSIDNDTINYIHQIAQIFINCAHYDAASKLLEDLIFIYEKQNMLKNSFEKIRSLAYCKFKMNNDSWRQLAGELIKTCGEIKETRELMLTQNFIGECLAEKREFDEAETIFKNLAELTRRVKQDDKLAQSDLSELYFTLGYNLAEISYKKNDINEALKIINSYLDVYETYKAKKKFLKEKKRKSGDSLTNFTVAVEFSVSDIADIAGKLYFLKARLLFEKKEYENSYKLLATAFDLLKNTDRTQNFYEILKFIISNEDKFKDKKLHVKFQEIRSKYDEIITTAKNAGN